MGAFGPKAPALTKAAPLACEFLLSTKTRRPVLLQMEHNSMTKILIAEDERDIRDLITFTLRYHGYEVHQASNGQEALDIARKVKPDLIMMDVRMPKSRCQFETHSGDFPFG